MRSRHPKPRTSGTGSQIARADHRTSPERPRLPYSKYHSPLTDLLGTRLLIEYTVQRIPRPDLHALVRLAVVGRPQGVFLGEALLDLECGEALGDVALRRVSLPRPRTKKDRERRPGRDGERAAAEG